MDTINYELEALTEEIEKILVETPHIANLLKAFAPLLQERSRWLQEVQSYKKVFPVDAEQFLEGVPLIRQCQLFLAEDPWKSASLSVATAISKGFPQLSGEMAAISQQVTDGTFAISTLVNSPAPFDDLDVLAQELGVSVAALQLFLRFLTRFILNKRSQDMATDLSALSWKKGYCPVCGTFPHLAIIGDKGQKSLQCSNCSHEWQFPRLTCPYCNHEDPEKTNIMYVDGKKEDSAFICSKCKRYLLTAHRADTLRRNHSDLIAISLSHLDIILQGKGFRPMIECEWNTFS